MCASLDALNPRDIFAPGGLDLLWASPECTHHSVARGGKPINDQSRATAWCVVRWAEALMPPVILIENVPEFITWGGIGADGRPMKSKKGATFAAWVGALESLGYKVGWKILCAADYGDPTTRRRLFIQAVRGKRRIVWPDATHSAPKAPDLFEQSRRPWVSAREIIDWTLPGKSIYERDRPLSTKTIRRIMAGLEKFGLKPFITTMEHQGSIRAMDRPLPTITTAKGGAMALAHPFLVEMRGTSDAQVENTARSIEQPMGTVTAGGVHHGLAEPFLFKVSGSEDRRPRSISEPMPTVTGSREWAFCDAALLPQQTDGRLRSVNEPVPTVSTGGAIAMVEPYLVEYYGNGRAQSVDDPLGTATTKGRFGLARPVVVVDGEKYFLDIRFRMLQPHELAAAQGFPAGYKFSGTKTDSIKQIGNAVPRNLARAIVLAALNQSSDITSFLQ